MHSSKYKKGDEDSWPSVKHYRELDEGMLRKQKEESIDRGMLGYKMTSALLFSVCFFLMKLN